MNPANVATTSYMFEGILLGAGLVAVLAWLSIRLATRVGLLDFLVINAQTILCDFF